jgi:hypothetical protein
MELLRVLMIDSMSLNEREQGNPFEMDTKGWGSFERWRKGLEDEAVY